MPSVSDPRYSNPSVDAANAIALPIFAVLSSLFIIFPFRAFYLLRNFPSCSICVTLWIINLMTFLNAILWNTDDWTIWWAGYGLCDVESILRWPITLSASTGLCCFTYGLANALNTDGTIFNPTRAQRRRKLIGEILFVWGPPALMTCLHYVIQVGRYAIVPVFGCTDELDNSWPVIVLIIIWGPLVTLASCYLGVLLLIRLRRHRKTISSALSMTGAGMVPRKFVKLAMIAMAILLVYLPIQVLFIFRSVPHFWVPYDWDRIHNPKYWGTISYYHTQDAPLLQYSGWAAISYGFLMLPFYGFNDEAICTYRRWLVMIGFGSCFPSLKEPYRPRGSGGSSFGSGSSTLGRFDIVDRAMKYFDTESHPGSRSRSRSQTRKGSQAQSFGTTNADGSTIGKETHSTSTTPVSSVIVPIPKFYTRFATIRSWNPFSPSTMPLEIYPYSSTVNTAAVPEKEAFPPIPNHREFEANTNNISTSIWSPSKDCKDTEIKSPADPLSPALGSRAYRERERREMERDKKKQRELVKGVVVQKSVDITEEASNC